MMKFFEWRRVVRTGILTYKQAVKADVATLAGSLAYTTVFSVVPLIAVVFYIFKTSGIFAHAYVKVEPYLLNNLSAGAGEEVQHQLQNFVHSRTESGVGWVGFAGLLITAFSMYNSVSAAFRKVWEVEKKRSLKQSAIRALIVLVFGPLLLATSIAVTTAVAASIQKVPGSALFFAYVLNVLLFGITYYLVPLVRISWKDALTGALLAGFLWEVVKSTFAFFTSKILKYSTLYGSLAAVPLFLLWIYVAWYVTFLGAALIKALQAQRKPSATKARTAVVAFAAILLGSRAVQASDAWYLLQTGGKPWGYYREQIEKRGDGYRCRIETYKKQPDGDFHESYGAIAGEDLRPTSINIIRNSLGATQTIDATFLKNKKTTTDQMRITIAGIHPSSFQRVLPKDSIVECLFASHIKSNLGKIRERKGGEVSVFIEDPEAQAEGRIDFSSKTLRYKYMGEDKANNCSIIEFVSSGLRVNECIRADGTMDGMTLVPERDKDENSKDKVTVLRVKNANEAKKPFEKKSK